MVLDKLKSALVILSTAGCGTAFAQQPNTIPASTVSNVAAANEIAQPIEREFEPGKLIAVVGEERILAGELMQMYEPKIAENLSRIPESQLPQIRQQLMRQALIAMVQTKMMSQEYLHSMVENKPAKEHKEVKEQFRRQAYRIFHEQYIPQLLKQYKVLNEVELDAKLRETGTSIEGLKMTFADSLLADEMIRKITPKTVYVDYLEIRERYNEKVDDWKRDARARFQLMSVYYRNFQDRDSAMREIQGMFEEIRTGGATFESVAKRRSQGPRAADGGTFDWTTKGALKSSAIDEAVFTLPTNRLSNIIEDSDGLHVVVVLERQDARTVPFSEAQEDVRKTLEKEKKQAIRNEFIEELTKRTPVWTLWPDDIKGSRPLAEAISIQTTQGQTPLN